MYFRDKFNPGVAVCTSMSDYRRQDQFINLPLYALSLLSGLEGMA
jgi:hypothetical protein